MSGPESLHGNPNDWVRDAPNHWTRAPLGTHFKERSETVSDREFQPLSVTKNGVVPQLSTAAKTDNNDNRKLVRVGDFAINSRSDRKGSSGISSLDGSVSVIYTVLQPRESIDGRFAHHLLRSPVFQEEFFRWGSGIVADLWSTRYSAMKRIPLAVPTLAQQRAIADYLDRETARIDTLIEEQQQLLEVLRERRAAVIDRAFIHAPSNSRVQHACLDVVDCPHTTPEIDDVGAYEAVRTSSVRDGKFRPDRGHRVGEQTWRDRNAGGFPTRGDVLFTREAPAGEACMVPGSEVCLGQRMVLLRIDPRLCRGEFMLWQIYSSRVQDHFRLSTNGSTVGNIRLPTLRSTPIWLPSLDEQRRIAEYLDDQTSKIDTLIAETERFIELSRDRRSALITAAVTGQIDVREEVA